MFASHARDGRGDAPRRRAQADRGRGRHPDRGQLAAAVRRNLAGDRLAKRRVIARVERDRGLKPEQTEARIRAQLSDEERRKHATIVIENNGTIAQLQQQLATIWADALKRNG